MKKIFLSILLFCFLAVLLLPLSAAAQNPIVPCDNTPNNPCDISAFFQLLKNIYDFIVIWIATPLAVISIIVGGVLMMISAGNPDLMNKGKQILKWAIIGLVLVFGSWVIIDFILKTIGFTKENWSTI